MPERDARACEGSYLRFDEMTWPNPDDPGEVEYALRYGSLKRSHELVAASFIAAYRQLVNLPRRERDERVAAIRAAQEDPHV